MSNLNKRFITSLFLLLMIYVAFMSFKILFFVLIIINVLVLDEIFKIIKKIYKNKSYTQFLFFFLALIYMTYFSLVIILFLNISFQTNKLTILFLLLICISTDIGGFLFGKIIGGKKLTKISPNKTYSGVIGSFLLSMLLGYLFYFTQKNLLILNLNIFVFIIIISLLSQFGDLIISIFKRKAQIKDTGNFLPGHGGILDRIDGILLALPIGIIFFYL
tara:strand:+ start:231 stop:884 length:654 start_codon:yes stop_codon:yes gene_type:complete